MKSQTIALSTGLALISGTYANKDVITVNANGNSWIQEAIATLVVPETPETVSGDIALWSAIMMDDYNGDFLQGVTQSSPAYVPIRFRHLAYAKSTLILTVSIARYRTVLMQKAIGAILRTLSKVTFAKSRSNDHVTR